MKCQLFCNPFQKNPNIILPPEDLLRASRALVSTDAVYDPAHPGLGIAPEAVPRYLVSAGLWYMAAAQA